MGFLKNLGETVISRLNPKTIASEVLDTAIGRVSHGAAEFAHGLLTQNTAYVPYGQDAMPITAPEVGPSDTPDTPEPEAPAAMPSLSEQYQTQVAMYAAMRGPSPSNQSPGL